jgi:ferredoxin
MTDPATTGESLEVIVDMDLCDGHGQCEFAAPNVFQMDDEGELQYDAHPDPSERARVEQAIRVCPVQAIRLGP